MDWRADRIGSCLRGENPTLITRMKSGFVVIGDTQFLPGYCVLLGYPEAKALNDLSQARRCQYLLDMTLVGDAILKACNPLRINYAILMNLDAFLHAHIQARYAWEPDVHRCAPVFSYPRETRDDPAHAFSEAKHGALRKEIGMHLQALMAQAEGYRD